MNGYRHIVLGDNKKVHEWFTAKDRLAECHCDDCDAVRLAAWAVKIAKRERKEKIYNATGAIAAWAIPITIMATATLCLAGHMLAGAVGTFVLAGEIVAASVICAKTNPWR